MTSKLSDDDDATQSSNDIGSIELRIFRVIKMEVTAEIARNVIPDDGPLQEKSKKLGGHRIG